jgi:steroid delta-isomerase-like uncharacterized protein
MKTRISLIVALGASLAVGCAKNNSASGSSADSTASNGSSSNGSMSMADSMKTAYKAIATAWDAGDAAAMDQYVSANVVEHNPMPGQAPGIAGMKAMVTGMKAAFPDEKTTIEDIRVDGNTLIARSRMSGTNSGPMMGMPATNKKMSDVMGIDIVRWENGKFVEHWGLFDTHAMMQQLGLMPPMPTSAPSNDKKM